MKKLIFLFLSGLLYTVLMPLHAKKVEAGKAESVAQRYVQSKQRLWTKPDVRLRYTATNRREQSGGIQRKNLQNGQDTVYYYVFNIDESAGAGFVIVAGDDAVRPVLGYSNNGNYDEKNLPPNFACWMDGLQKEIGYVQAKNLPQSNMVQQEWNHYSANDLTDVIEAVAPLLQTEWNQRAPYNNMCPEVGGNRSVTGCVATAMAQLMKYHRHPVRGSGSGKAYTTPTSGISIPDVNFSVNYDWNNMLNSYSGNTSTQQQTAVATLMYHCGVSVKMNYSPSGSGASNSDVVTALTTCFGYDKSIIRRDRAYFDTPSWEAMLRAQIDAGLPVFYCGQDRPGSPSTGHAFICDGYDNADSFHFNWGWGGMYDGYFVTTALNPGVGGTGAGNGAYNYGQEIIINIKQDDGGVANYEMALYEDFSASSTSVLPGGSFTVSAKLKNIGQIAFPGGSLGAALVDNNGQIVEMVGNITTIGSLPNGSYWMNPRTLSCNIPNNVAAGKYTLRVVVRSTGEQNWKIITMAAACDSSFDFWVGNSPVSVTGIELDSSSLSLVVDDTEQLMVTVLPADASNKNVTWTSSDTSIAAVNHEGTVTAISGGVAIITVKSHDGEKAASCSVTVSHNYEITLNEVFSVSSASVSHNEPFTVSVKAGNVGPSTFPGGSIGAALIDDNGQIAEVVGSATRGSLPKNMVWNNPFEISCTVSGSVAAGEYKLQAVVKSSNEEWKIITSSKDCPNSFNVQVIAGTIASNDATLKDMSISSGILSPVFAVNITDYIVEVPDNVTSITITGTTNHSDASLTGTGTKTLNVGENNFNIVVTAEDGVTTRTYTLTVIRQEQIPVNVAIGGTVAGAPAGTRVELYNASQTKNGIPEDYEYLGFTRTDNNGNYLLPNLPYGIYIVVVVMDGYDAQQSEPITFANGITKRTINFTVNGDTNTITPDVLTSAAELLFCDLSLYPNPFADEVRISGFPADMLHATSLHVINTAGVIVHTQMITNPVEPIRLAFLPAGIYFFRMETDGKEKTMKGVKIQ